MDYIEGIARTFEARNYLVMATAFATSLATQFGGLSTGGLTAIIMILLSRVLMSGDILENICDVVPARLSFQAQF
ncbi:MAG: YIEGIA domain-containing protein [Candidatus Syntrophopropionicum ammoniitolerans]